MGPQLEEAVGEAPASDEQVTTEIGRACQGLMITAEELYRELEQGGDIPDLRSGALTPHGLRLTAETLALMRYSKHLVQRCDSHVDDNPSPNEEDTKRHAA